jgi:hypothetical protein
VRSPEELTVADPACGAGHMLTYAFDLLYLIYEEEGYNPPEIPRLILEKNLFGMEIDPRSAALAAFALTMKARGRDRRFLRRGATPHICAYTPATVTEAELRGAAWFKELSKSLVDLPIRDALLHDLGLWAQIANIGSLLQPQLTLEQIETLQDRIGGAGNLLDELANERVLGVLEQLAYLARKYCVVVANPPYMGGGMNDELSAFLKDNYETVKSDLFAAFIARNLELALPKGQLGFMSPFVWMFISSYEKLRQLLIEQKTITSLVQLEYSGFAGATVPICTFTVENAHRPDFKGGFVRLSDFRGPDNQGPRTLEAIGNSDCGWFYRASAADFKKIPGSPIAYWLGHFEVFEREKLDNAFLSAGRLKTHDGDRYIRFIWEVARDSGRWKRIIKGGDFRKYFGHEVFMVDWSKTAVEFFREKGGLPPEHFGGRVGICWSKITSSHTAFRIKNAYTEYDAASPTIVLKQNSRLELLAVLAYLDSFVSRYLLTGINPTLNTQVGDVLSLPLPTESLDSSVAHRAQRLCDLTKEDWDSFEESWDFARSPLLPPSSQARFVYVAYSELRNRGREAIQNTRNLEEENNRIFIDAYGLQDELTPDVPLSEITLTCNPHYRYGGNKSEEELERLLKADTMREFISYAAGCMFGRYSLDKPGLILANQGETVADYARIVGPSTALRSAQDAEEQGGWGAREQGGRGAGERAMDNPQSAICNLQSASCPTRTTSSRSWTATGSPTISSPALAASCASRSARRTMRRTWRSSRPAWAAISARSSCASSTTTT